MVCCIPPANEPPSLGVSSRETRDATRGCLCFSGPPFCYLLCSRRQVNCQINPTGQPDYFFFASTTHQFPYFYCFILSLYFLIRFSLSFIQSCLCLVFSSFCTQRVSQPPFFISLFSAFYFVLFTSPLIFFILLLFSFLSLSFQSHSSRQNLVSILSFPLHQVLFIFRHLTFSSDPRSFLRAFPTPLFEAKRRVHSDIPTPRSLHQNIITVPGSHTCTVGRRKGSGRTKDLNTEYVR